jgi:uncharacterized protein
MKNDKVTAVVYRINLAIGVFVAVDNKYFGLVPNGECFTELHEGDCIEARVIRVRDDGKLDLSVRELSHLQMDKDALIVLEEIRKSGGFLPLNDKSSPLEIENRLKLSKAAFKRAVGKLLKERKVVKLDNGLKETALV